MAELQRLSRPQVDTRQVRRHFSRHAVDYARYAVVQKAAIAGVLDLLDACGQLSGRALEVGCGTGMLTRQIAERFPGMSLTVFDIAHEMTRQSANSVLGVSAVDADAQALPFKAGRFGLLLSSSVYQWVNDLPLAFGEALRVLAPGGYFAFALFGERTLYELRDSHRRAAAVLGMGRSHVQSFPASAEVRDALSASGFEAISVRSRDEVERHPRVEDLLRSLKRIGAQNAAGERPRGLGSRRVMQEMIRIYRERYGMPQHIPATYEVIYGTARKALL